MKVYELLDAIRKRDLLLPEFQREYVWNRDQAKQLIVSLLKAYPVGALLFWKTDSPPELKNVDHTPNKLGTIQVILDGQQRLTTLYTLLEGEIPPYYTEADIQYDPRDLYYDLNTGELQYYQPSRMRANLLWQRVIDCFKGNPVNVFELARQQAKDDQEAFALAQQYNANLNRLVAVKQADIPVQTVPSYASLDEAIDIFDRINSQGTKLTDAELALTHITGKWSTARRQMKEKIQELNGRHFHFDLTFMTRALTGVVTHHALFETIHNQPREELERGWARLAKILDYLVNLLPQRAYVHSTEDLNTTNVLVPLVVYLGLQGGKFPNAKALQQAIRWIYAAHTWARYTAQTDQRLEHDVGIVVREESPWKSLEEEIIDLRGRVEVKPSDFEGRGGQHPLYLMVYILAKAHGAVDWFNGLPLGTPHGSTYRIHNHHIFPQSVLYRSGYDEDNHLHRKIVNEIANRAFLTAETNLSVSNRLPEKYLPEVEQRYPGALSRQFIPVDPLLWKVERFPDFLEARREIMTRKLNEFVKALVSEPEPQRERPFRELISLGEGPNLEFKSTLQWDVIQNQSNKHLRHSVLKTITAFLNTEGGTLLIGVDEGGGIYGLETDLGMLDGSLDRFGQLISSLISDYLSPGLTPLIKIRFEELDGKKVCVVDVGKSSEPVFLKGERGKEFYVRVGNTTRPLDPEQTVSFISSNWG